MSVKMHLDNVLASANLGTDLDMEQIIGIGRRKRSGPENMDCFSYRIPELGTTVQIFPSGKIVLTGNTLYDVESALDSAIDDLIRIGIIIPDRPVLTIHNIVASGDLKKSMDLSRIALHLGLERAEYEPEQFPGLVYRMDDPLATILLFTTGKIICTGVSEASVVKGAAAKMASLLSELD